MSRRKKYEADSQQESPEAYFLQEENSQDL
jgi:hypothetical protein